ncbi:YihY/virulence factor BrkB family protein [candidate division FCPU426 bacterium]|nr:YihY/virulence factor BrkB family protein [candidate division FCPU426 bacterium]
MYGILKIIRRALAAFYRDRLLADAGALAFFLLLALAPFSVFLRWTAEIAGKNAQEAIIGQAEAVATLQSKTVLTMLLKHTHHIFIQGPWAPYLSLAVVLLSLFVVFAHIHYVLNKIWCVAPKQHAKWTGFFHKQMIPMAMLLVAGIILIFSLFVSAAVALLTKSIGLHWKTLEMMSTFIVAGFTFFLMYKWIPDQPVFWRHASLGGLLAALMFEAGRYGLEKYLVVSGILSWYGSSGPLVALLMWFYYSSLIIFFGGEITKAAQDLSLTEKAEPGMA